MDTSKIWFITGVSGGIGRALALEVALSGDIAIGTLRKPEQFESFNKLVPGKTFAVQLDVNNHEQISQVVDQVINQFGTIDVLVNNAGYGVLGAIEEVTMEEARQQMETNFFGVLAVTKAVLPVMRQQKSGAIVQVSSQAGMKGNSGLGLYNASKFALEGLSEALYVEMKPLNIHVILVEPGPFRTEWAGVAARAKTIIEDYSTTAGKVISNIINVHGKQVGDPAKAAKAIIQAVKSENPPLHMPLGEQAIRVIREKLKSVEQNITEWETIAADTAFDL
jgi:NAD(P)-dependent dehydrogenase (short-subunit alcohol dehydrogenase family)